MRQIGALLVVISLALPALADIVYLTNGRTIDGKVIERTKDKVVLEVVYGTITLAPSEIKRIKTQSQSKYYETQAEQLLKNGIYAKAIEQYKLALNQGKNTDVLSEKLYAAYTNWIKSLLSNQQYGAAAPIVADALGQYPGDKGLNDFSHRIEERQKFLAAFIESTRILLDEGKYDEAIAKLEDIATGAGDIQADASLLLASAYAGKANKALFAKDPTTAVALYDQALAANPQSLTQFKPYYIFAKHALAGKALESGNLAQANTLADELLTLDDEYPFAWFVKGLYHESKREGDKAKDAFINTITFSGAKPESQGLRKTKEQAATIAKVALPEQPEGTDPFAQIDADDWIVEQTPHFIIHARNYKVTRTLKRQVEQHLKSITRNLGLRNPRQRIPIYVYPTQEEYQNVGGVPSWSGGVTLSQFKGGQMDIRIATYQGSPGLLNGVIPHEIVHALLWANHTGQRPVPLAIHEGLAVTQEPAVRRNYLWRVNKERLKAGAVMPIDVLLASEAYPSDAHGFYAQSYSVMAYLLNKYGATQLDTFLVSCGKYGPIKALDTAFGIKSLEVLNKEWLAFAKGSAP